MVKRQFAGYQSGLFDEEDRFVYVSDDDIILVRASEVEIPLHRFQIRRDPYYAMSISTGLLINPKDITYSVLKRLIEFARSRTFAWKEIKYRIRGIS